MASDKPKYVQVAEHFFNKKRAFTYHDIITQLWPKMSKGQANNLIGHIEKMPWKFRVEVDRAIVKSVSVKRLRIMSIIGESEERADGVFSTMHDPRNGMSDALKLALGYRA